MAHAQAYPVLGGEKANPLKESDRIPSTTPGAEPMHLTKLTEFRQSILVQSHLEIPGILVQLGHIQRT